MLMYSETPNLHTHTLKVAIIHAADYRAVHDREFTFDVFRRTIARRLHLLDPLRYRLIDVPWKLHHPMWLEDCPVDLDYHLRRVQVPAPGGRRELDQVVGKVHHTLADGVASANLPARLMDLTGSAQDEHDDYVTCDPPAKRQLLWQAQLDHFQNMAALPRLISDAARGSYEFASATRSGPTNPTWPGCFRRRQLF
jgi:diacylglycerol O-acyltransferase / wax synthase